MLYKNFHLDIFAVFFEKIVTKNRLLRLTIESGEVMTGNGL